MSYEQVVLLWDASPSMKEEVPDFDGTPITKMDAVRKAVQAWAQAFDMRGHRFQLACVIFSDRPSVLFLFEHPRSPLIGQRSRQAYISGKATDIAAALQLARELLSSRRGPKRVIVLTDGWQSLPGDPVAEARACVEEGIRVDVIGFGAQGITFSPQAMQQIAAAGCGQYSHATDLPELVETLIRFNHYRLAV